MDARTTLPERFRRPWAWVVALVGIACLALVVVFASRVFPRRRRAPVILATATPQGEYARFGSAFASVVNDHQDQFTVEARTTSGSAENVDLLDRGEADFAVVESDTPMPPSVRAVASLFLEPFHLLVAADSGIGGIEDLRGKRVTVMPNLLGAHGQGGFFDALLKRYGLAREDLAAVTPLALGRCADQVGKRELDAALLAIAIGNESVGTLLRTRPVRLAPLDVHVIRTWHPYVVPTTIHRGAYWGHPPIPREDVPTAAVEALLLTHARVPDDIVREMTRRLMEHRNELLREIPHAITIHDPDSGRDLGIPMHPGARAWYARGEPGFVVLYAEVIGLLLSIGGVTVTGLWHLRSRVQRHQRDRAEALNLEMFILLERAHEVMDAEALGALRREVFDLLKKVLEDLDQGRISGESFLVFSVPCRLALDAVRHRETILGCGDATPS